MERQEEKWADFSRGKLRDAWTILGAHPTEDGTAFAVWAPNARAVAVTGDFCFWNENGWYLNRGENGVWSGFIPEAREGQLYKYIVEGADGVRRWKADPFAFGGEVRPGTSSRIAALRHDWQDYDWMNARRALEGPRNIYEVHLGSWRRHEDGSFYTWDDFVRELVPYVRDMGYTHVELLPVTEHPFDGSWGYQVTGYYAATARFGNPEGLMRLIDAFHQNGIGVILDWVPGHFCRDEHGLGMFDGTHLYDAGDMPGWGTYQFDFDRPEVRSFLVSSAMFWVQVYHADGLRVDGVSSMLYLNFSVQDPAKRRYNVNGGDENLGAVSLLQEVNAAVGADAPGAFTCAEESTAWPMVTYPPEQGGLGFHYKWDMGWMNDTLRYMSCDFDERREKHNLLTFSMVYAFSENYLLPLSHDEVVHGKRSLIGRMPGDWWRQFAGVRLLYTYAAAHPGGMLSFMGNEFAQFIEWREYESLEWKMLDYPTHAGVQHFVRELNGIYRREKALWDNDHDWNGFVWMDADNAGQGILSFARKSRDGEIILCVLNFRPESREDWRTGVPKTGEWVELINSDDTRFGGSGKTNPPVMKSVRTPFHGQRQSLRITVPPLGGTLIKYKGPLPRTPKTTAKPAKTATKAPSKANDKRR